jgi:ketosteroid isomerase-like protein
VNRLVPWVIGLALLASPVTAAELASVALPADLARVLTDYEVAWQKEDARALAALFAEDGFVLSSGVLPVRGRAAIEKHYTGLGGALSLRAFAYSTDGSIGYIVGGFAWQKGSADIGKFTLTLQKSQDGRWLIMSDMDNGNSKPLCVRTRAAEQGDERIGRSQLIPGVRRTVGESRRPA